MFISFTSLLHTFYLCTSSVPTVAFDLLFLNAGCLEGASFLTAPAPFCRHFNDHRDPGPFFQFGQQGLDVQADYITALLAEKTSSAS